MKKHEWAIAISIVIVLLVVIGVLAYKAAGTVESAIANAIAELEALIKAPFKTLASLVTPSSTDSTDSTDPGYSEED